MMSRKQLSLQGVCVCLYVCVRVACIYFFLCGCIYTHIQQNIIYLQKNSR